MNIPLPPTRLEDIQKAYNSNPDKILKRELPIERINQIQTVNSILQLGYLTYKREYERALLFDEYQKYGNRFPNIPYRPLNWGRAGSIRDMEQLVMLRTNVAETDDNGQIYGWFFDAVLKEHHSLSRTITAHPVQSGVAITDHSFQNPATLTLEIGMSDVMDSFIENQYMANVDYKQGRKSDLNYSRDTKSKNAYKELVRMMKAGLPLTIQTRLERYNNMVIESIETEDNNQTFMGLRCTVRFKEIIVGKTAKIKKSMLPQVTEPSNKTTPKLKSLDTFIMSSVGMIEAKVAGANPITSYWSK